MNDLPEEKPTWRVPMVGGEFRPGELVTVERVDIDRLARRSELLDRAAILLEVARFRDSENELDRIGLLKEIREKGNE